MAVVEEGWLTVLAVGGDGDVESFALVELVVVVFAVMVAPAVVAAELVVESPLPSSAELKVALTEVEKLEDHSALV